MTIERELYFANGSAYSITGTVAQLMDIRWDRVNADLPVVNDNIFAHIVEELNKFRFYDNINNPDFLVDPNDGVVTQTDLWWNIYGERVVRCDLSVGTFDVSDDSFALEGEECIVQDIYPDEIELDLEFVDMDNEDDDMRAIMMEEEERSTVSV